jgi:hypothetical protein
MNTSPVKNFPPVAAAFLLFSVFHSPARAAGPDDVYFSAHSVQTYKYYAFVNDFVIWNDATYTGTSLFHTAVHDTTETVATVSMATTADADTGVFTADLSGEIYAEVRTGIFHQTYNNLDVSVYIHAPSGTPYSITLDVDATLQASRVGGLPGGIQPVNGVSTATLEDSTLNVPNGGVQERNWETFQLFSGTTAATILVDGETYSLARTLNLNSYTSVTQALCIIGCMTASAQFHALSSGHYRINVYPIGAPSAVRNVPSPTIALSASPNPWSGSTQVSFEAPQGTHTTVDVFDVRGRLVAQLFDAPATGAMQTMPWNASNLASGVYFLRAQSGRVSSTKKVMLLK